MKVSCSMCRGTGFIFSAGSVPKRLCPDCNGAGKVDAAGTPPPGRELDALVAEKVMGWTWNPATLIQTTGMLYPHDATQETTRHETKALVPPGGFDGSPIPHYSTDIAAAWAVFTRLSAEESTDDMTLMITFSHVTNEWIVSSWEDGDWERAGAGASAPHAICLAALKTVAG